MDIDLPYILFWAVLACGLIWLADLVLLRRQRLAEDIDAPDPLLVEYAKSFFPVLLLVLLLRSFLAEPYQIPSESMVPTLEVGDFILVNKYAYGLRLPVFGTKILDVGEPQRGDVMVFVPPNDPRYFIKRVIGIPGDHVRYDNKALTINGEAVPYRLVGDVVGGTRRFPMREYVETIDGRAHRIRRTTQYAQPDEWQLGPGQYLMLGDNRDRSADSREWGLASEANIVGKAVAIWLHKEPGWAWPNFDRNQWIEGEVAAISETDD
ncbi:MAG: signal peptidase I [Pseudomonadota bacterium]